LLEAQSIFSGDAASKLSGSGKIDLDRWHGSSNVEEKGSNKDRLELKTLITRKIDLRPQQKPMKKKSVFLAPRSEGVKQELYALFLWWLFHVPSGLSAK